MRESRPERAIHIVNIVKLTLRLKKVEATERVVDEETLDTEKKERKKREIKPRSLGEGTAQKGIGGCGLRLTGVRAITWNTTWGRLFPPSSNHTPSLPTT